MFRSAELQFLRGSSVVATFLVSVPSISVFGMEKPLSAFQGSDLGSRHSVAFAVCSETPTHHLLNLPRADQDIPRLRLSVTQGLLE